MVARVAKRLEQRRTALVSALWYIEFGTYVVLAVIVMHGCFELLAGVSGRHYRILKRHLHPPWGWLSSTSRGIDKVDTQWRELWYNFPSLTAALALYVALSRTVRSRGSPAALLRFQAITGALVLIALHGVGFVFEFFFFVLNFFFSRLHFRLPYWAFMAVMWTAHIALLIVNDRFKGYSLGSMIPALAPLDSVQGTMRWYVLFNFSTLRMISFNYDFYEACAHGDERRAKVAERHVECVDCAVANGRCFRARTDSPHATREYNFVAYVAYLMYPPLFIAGPITSFNAFVSHVHVPQRWFHWRRDGVVYASRIAFLVLCQMLLLHYDHINAIRRHPEVIARMNKRELAAFGLFILAFLWMKFSVIWKFMRLFAMLDGVEVPENMNRCFANSLSVTHFWRDWHASFNAWIVRYMYVPLGGAKRKALVVFPIFAFIALWHDIKMHLFVWAMVMAVAMIPELIITAQMSKPRYDWLRAKPYFRFIKAIGGACSVFTLIAANLVGYGIGTGNARRGFAAVFSLENAAFALEIMFYLFVGANVSIAERSREAAKRAKLKAQLTSVL